MIDAGYSTRAKDIKHYTEFESKLICKLISSPYYIGRGASCKCYTPDLYLKNKRLCKLIDILRYKKIRRGCGCSHHTICNCIHLDGGSAPAVCGFKKVFDLGNAEIICDNHHNSSECCP